jgi:hypothetical protein
MQEVCLGVAPRHAMNGLLLCPLCDRTFCFVRLIVLYEVRMHSKSC